MVRNRRRVVEFPPRLDELGLVSVPYLSEIKDEMKASDITERVKTFGQDSPGTKALAQQGLFIKEYYTALGVLLCCAFCGQRVRSTVENLYLTPSVRFHRDSCCWFMHFKQRVQDKKDTDETTSAKLKCTRCKELSNVLFLPCRHIPFCSTCFIEEATGRLSATRYPDAVHVCENKNQEDTRGGNLDHDLVKPQKDEKAYLDITCPLCQQPSKLFKGVLFA